MPATPAQVSALIKTKFPGAEPHIQTTMGRINGTIVWRGFARMSVSDRNKLVSERIRDALGLNGLNIGILFPLASEEEQ